MSGIEGFAVLRDQALRSEIEAWWEWLQNQRGAKAELRRCDTVEAVLLCGAFRKLWVGLAATGQRREKDLLAWASVAATLAEVKNKDGAEHSFAARLGCQKEKTGKPLVSELRFAQLQKSRDNNTFLRRLRRALALVERKAPLLSLADSVLLWHQEQSGRQSHKPTDRLAVRWAMDYFTALDSYPTV